MVGKTVSHYRILEELGRGGMGIVYAAQDVKLGRKVALKVLAQEVASDHERVQRFVREAQAASAINHPNIATIYEIDDVDGLTFIAMEFVEGATLRDRIASGIPSFDEILDLSRQIARALGTAHGLGIVHRDIKPENIVVRPDGLVKILDFGLAKLLQDADVTKAPGSVTLTREGAIMGTARYMSPEQARGTPVDARCDVFALGAVMYEMACNRPAFPGESHVEVLYAVVNTPPAPMSDDAGIPREFQAIVARALAKSAADRFADCGAVAVELERLGTTGSTALGTQLGSIGATTWHTATGVIEPHIQETTWIDPQHSIAVLPFRNMSGNPDADWMRSGLQVMLGSDLSQVPTLRVVPADRLATLMADLKLGPNAALDEMAVRSIGEFLNVDTIVSGSFVKLGPASRVDVSIRRPATGEERHEKAEAADEAELLKVVAHLAAQVRRAIQTDGARDVVVTMVGEKGSEDPDAIRAYVDGLAKLYEGNNIEAERLLSEAVESDPDFALAHTYLGEALSNSGRMDEARAALKQASTRGSGLTRADSLFITAREAMASGDIDRAIEAFELLVQLLPNNLGAVYELAQAYELKGDWDGAIRNLTRIIELDPKFVTALFALGRVNIKKGSGQAALDFLYRALSLNTLLGNDEGRATVLNAIGLANYYLDRYDEALEYYEDSLVIKRKIGDRRGESATLSNEAVVYQVRGEYEKCIETYGRALAISEELGDERGTAENLINLGTAYEERGSLDEALDSYKRALKVEADLGDRMAEILCLNDIGNIYFTQGRIDDAEVYFQRALEARRQLGEKKGIAISLNYLGNIERLRGRYDKAVARYLEALRIAKEIGWRSGEAETRGYVASVMARQGRYAAALESQEEALRIFEELGDKNGVAVSLAARSRVECSLGECETAAETVERALEMAREIGNEELVADAILARGTVGNLSGSDSVVEDLKKARQHADASGGRITYLQVASELGRALRRGGRLEESLQILSSTSDEARRLGLESIRAVSDFYNAETLLEQGDREAAAAVTADALKAAESMGERELVVRCRCLLARIVGERDESCEHAAICLEEVSSLARELGAGAATFIQRPDIASDITSSARILRDAGRAGDFERFPELNLGG
ncbi:MAG: tetratricopeptide repeat protein [Armatimonadetes bacterium]|nr:tetratricopeptide repeat protein [Armatimonadota bacterium]